MSQDRGRGDAEAVLDGFRRLPDPDARSWLLTEFLPLAEHLAQRFSGRGEPLEDLRQVASVGLLHAIDRFDPDRGVHFTTYASATILGELKRHFRDKGWAIHLPRSLQESAMLVSRTLRELWQELGRSPTIREIAERAGLTEEQVLESMDAAQGYATSSLDAPVSEDGMTFSETLGEIDDAFERSEGWMSIAGELAQLPERERRILFLRFFRGMTQSEIASEIGISQMHVSRLLSQTLERLREAST